jgi:threonine dehydrogenase-like Zn-dependent dehydrogenase
MKLGLETAYYSPLEVPDFEKHSDFFPGRHLEDRYNVTAVWKGKEDYNKLMLMGHHDTVRIGDPANWVIEPAASIVNAVSYMDLKPAHRVLLIGAGFMGLLMVQLIKGYPFSEFVVCDVKESSREMARKCGAQVVCTPEEVEGLFDRVIECSGSQSGLDLAVRSCGMAGDIYLFGWHRFDRTIDFKTQHLRGNRLIHTSPALDDGREYSRYWPMTIKLFERGVFDLSLLISHKYRAEDVDVAFVDSVKREEGFVKSVVYLEGFPGNQ